MNTYLTKNTDQHLMQMAYEQILHFNYQKSKCVNRHHYQITQKQQMDFQCCLKITEMLQNTFLFITYVLT